VIRPAKLSREAPAIAAAASVKLKTSLKQNRIAMFSKIITLNRAAANYRFANIAILT
jgi:hypothetical protein